MLLVGVGLDVGDDVVHVQALDGGAPRRIGEAVKDLEGFEAQVEHPLRLALVRADVTHDLFIDAALRGLAGRVGIMPAVGVITELLDDLVILFEFLFVHTLAIGHILAHLHVGRGVGRCWVSLTLTLPPIHHIVPTLS